jgi:hypothetical protein
LGDGKAQIARRALALEHDREWTGCCAWTLDIGQPSCSMDPPLERIDSPDVFLCTCLGEGRRHAERAERARAPPRRPDQNWFSQKTIRHGFFVEKPGVGKWGSNWLPWASGGRGGGP